MRRFSKLTDLDNGSPWEIPVLERQEELDVPYRLALVEPIGADGAFDPHGTQRSPMDAGEAMVGFTLHADAPADFEMMYRAMLAAACGATRYDGLRKLWRYDPDDGGGQRWAYARLAAKPPLLRSREHALHLPVSLSFRLPDPHFYDALTEAWLTGQGCTPAVLGSAVVGEPIDPDFVFAEFTITSTPYNFSLLNNGDLTSRRVIFRFASQGTNGFTNPSIQNLTNGHSFQQTRTGTTASHVLSVNAAPGLGRARLSIDDGVSWTDDTPNLLLGSSQAVLMEIEPGANSLRFTDGGTPNLKLLIWYLHAFRD